MSETFNRNDFFKFVQDYMRDVPLLLIGTGGTMPYGIPGMEKLSDRLINTLDQKYKANTEWDKFVANINSGKDLESSLTGLNLKEDILNDIIVQTWILVNDADIKLLNKILCNKEFLPIARLIKMFYNTQPQCVNIITTNYDRVIEYACDQFKIPIDKRFEGYYLKTFSQAKLRHKNIVNLIKVHGSLDLFKDENDYVYSIPLQKNIPDKFTPAIVTPGEDKYKTILNGECRDLVHIADDLINNAKSFLCIGYGFNDIQIQRNVIEGIKQDKPIVVVTKKISDGAVSLITNNSRKHVIIQEDEKNHNKTDIIINKKRFQLEGIYWDLENFLEIF